MAIEIVASYHANSLMLFSDGLHMLTHALALGISLIAFWIGGKKASSKYPLGLEKIEVVAAMFNGVGLIIFTIYIFYESYLRVINPAPIDVIETVTIAIIGLAVNLTTAWILFKAGIEDLNTKSAYLHLLSDTFSSVAIILGAVIISFTGWMIIDPLLSIIVGIVILKWSFGLLRDAVDCILNRQPKHLTPENIAEELVKDFEIEEVRDMRIWAHSTTNAHCSALLVFDDETGFDTAHTTRIAMRRKLATTYNIQQAFLEIRINQSNLVKNFNREII